MSKYIIEIDSDTMTKAKAGILGSLGDIIAQGTLVLDKNADDLISRENLRKDISTACFDCASRGEDNFNCTHHCPIYDCLNHINNAPAVEVFTIDDIRTSFDLGHRFGVKAANKLKGEWVDREYRRYLPRDAEPDYNNDTYDEKTHSVMSTHIVCSNCGAERHFYHNYCGNCGAEMQDYCGNCEAEMTGGGNAE